jgi:hypothetical protein
MILPCQRVVSEVLVHTKQKFFLGSTNKIAGTNPGVSKRLAGLRKKGYQVDTHLQRAQLAGQHFPPKLRDTIDNMRQTGQISSNPAGLVHVFDNVISGNCYDQALYALGVFGTRGISTAERIDLVDGDHSLVAVGRVKTINGQDTNLQDLATWGDAAFICDPWTNIACLAKDYPQRWNEKMDKWQKRGLQIGYFENNVYKFIEAKEEKNSPVEHQKRSADRLLTSGAWLTLYVYNNGMVIERFADDSLTYIKTAALGNPVAFLGRVTQKNSDLYVCPYVSQTTVCKRYQWGFQTFTAPLPKIDGASPYTLCAKFLKDNLFADVNLPVPESLDQSTNSRAFETYLDSLLDWRSSGAFGRFVLSLFAKKSTAPPLKRQGAQKKIVSVAS